MFRLILLSLSLAFLSLPVQAEKLYNYKIVKVIDGDTVNIVVDFLPIELGDTIAIRILGIDTPEIHGKCVKEIEKAKMSKERLKKFISDGEYSIVIKGRDKYFRILGDIKVKDTYASKVMVEEGHAIVYNGKTEKSWCE